MEESSLPDLPEDIITEVLTCLPVKPLLRFRSVSKPFQALIDSPDFIKCHLNRSFLTKTNHKLILQQLCCEPTSIYSVDLYKLDQTLELDHPLKSDRLLTQMIGSVNGLLCLINREYDIVIWNFATRNYHQVPVRKIKFPDTKCSNRDVSYGFGYDSISDDYKLLRLVRFYGRARSTNSEAMVYSLRSNSWQRIQDFPYRIRYGECNGRFACGALHWVVTHNHGSNTTSSIAAFDLATNKYKLVDHPEFQDDDVFYVTKLEGRLSMVCCKSLEQTDVWVMNNYGLKESWSKLLSVSNPEVVGEFVMVDPLAYSSSGTEIMLVQDENKLLWYSPKEERVRTISLRGRPDDFESEICVESLVSLCGKAKDCAKRKSGQIQKSK